MPHRVIANITNRKGNKVALFLTFEQAAGCILGALPAFIVTRGMPWWLQALIVLVAAGLGLLATVEIGGLAGYERGVWLVRGWIAARMQGARITPTDLAGARPIAHRDAARPVAGRVRAVPDAQTRRRAVPVPAPSQSAVATTHGPIISEREERVHADS